MLDKIIQILNLVDDDKKITELTDFIQFLNKLKDMKNHY
jgi:hypothetical protein